MIRQFNSSDIVLILANCIPIVGILFFEWSLFSVLTGYWAETAIIGVFTLLKLLYLVYVSPLSSQKILLVIQIVGITLSVAGFMFAHFILIMGLFSLLYGGDGWAGINLFVDYMPQLLLITVSMCIGHGYSFVRYFIYGKESQKMKADLANQDASVARIGHLVIRQVMQRITVTHISLIIGVFASILINKSSLVISIIFVIVKTVIDLGYHRRKHAPSTQHI